MAARECVGAVIVAAGGSSRMRGTDKLFAAVGGRPLLAHILARFQEASEIDRAILVLSTVNLERGQELVERHGFNKVTAICEGGPRRQDSVRLGLEALGECDWVLVHDGARLLVHPCVADGLRAARETGAAVPAIPIADTVKEVGERRTVLRTLDRTRLWAAQTPQVFRYALLTRAHREITVNVTDDAAMVEALGVPVKLFSGSPLNMKVTSPEDLLTAEALLEAATSP